MKALIGGSVGVADFGEYLVYGPCVKNACRAMASTALEFPLYQASDRYSPALIEFSNELIVLLPKTMFAETQIDEKEQELSNRLLHASSLADVDPSAALKVCELALQESGSQESVLWQKYHLHESLNQHEEALQALQKIEPPGMLDVERAYLQVMIATTLSRLGRKEDCVEAIKSAAFMAPPDYKIHVSRIAAFLYASLSMPEEAKKEIISVLEKSEKQESGLIQLTSQIALRLKPHGDAVDFVNRMLQSDVKLSDVDRSQLIMTRAVLHGIMGHFDSALSDLNRSVNLNPSNETALRLRYGARVQMQNLTPDAVNDLYQAKKLRQRKSLDFERQERSGYRQGLGLYRKMQAIVIDLLYRDESTPSLFGVKQYWIAAVSIYFVGSTIAFLEMVIFVHAKPLLAVWGLSMFNIWFAYAYAVSQLACRLFSGKGLALRYTAPVYLIVMGIGIAALSWVVPGFIMAWFLGLMFCLDHQRRVYRITGGRSLVACLLPLFPLGLIFPLVAFFQKRRERSNYM